MRFVLKLFYQLCSQLQSKFGTGKLLDGSHELVNTQPIFMDKKSFALSHAIPGKGALKVSNFVRENVNDFLDGKQVENLIPFGKSLSL